MTKTQSMNQIGAPKTVQLKVGSYYFTGAMVSLYQDLLNKNLEKDLSDEESHQLKNLQRTMQLFERGMNDSKRTNKAI